MKSKILFALAVLIISAVLYFNWEDPDKDLGDNYFYLPKYEAVDVGWPEAIIYKSPEKLFFQDIKIEGDVIRVSSNKDFILAIQKQVSVNVEKESFDSNTIKSFKYFIISKKSDSVHGPYKKEEYLQKRKELGVPKELQLKDVLSTTTRPTP